MVGYEDAHTRPEDFSPSGHSFLEVLEPVLVERNHVNHVLEAVNMKLFGTPVRRPKTISLLTPGYATYIHHSIPLPSVDDLPCCYLPPLDGIESPSHSNANEKL